MHPLVSTRRRFLQNSVLFCTAAAAPQVLMGATKAKPTTWTIGCLNRPWVKFSADEMLDGVKAAGYSLVGLQTPTPSDPFAGAEAKPAYLSALKEKIAARGLKANVARLRTKDAAPYADGIADIRQQVANAKSLGLSVMINTGTGKPAQYEAWYKLMAFAAAHAADHGIQIVTKPHGTVTAAAAELQKCLEKINHPNLGIWYDAGNVIYYTGKDPLQELEPIISHVTAFTAKDCVAKDTDVMIQLGKGKVDFLGLFRRLQKAGFKGPIMLETGAPADTAAQTTALAKENRLFLE
ncbi:MAG: hypothetical protein RIQ93_2935, partial [Verrucomicrobiota bacterium]